MCMAFRWAPYISLETANRPEVGVLVKCSSPKLQYLVGEIALVLNSRDSLRSAN